MRPSRYRAAGRERGLPAGRAAPGWQYHHDRSTVFASQLSGKEGEPPVEPAAAKSAVLTAAAVLVLGIAGPAFGAPGPDPSPHGGAGPRPEPSGGRARATVQTAPRITAAPA